MLIITNINYFINYLENNNLNINEVGNKYIEAINETLFFKDVNYKIIWTNREKSLLKNYNLKKNKLYQESCYKLFALRDEPCSECPLRQSKKSLKQEKHYICLSGETFFTKVFPVKNNEQLICGFIQIVSNITKKEKLKEELKNKNRKIDLFTNLSHELRTPLNLMHSSLQIIDMQFNKLEIPQSQKNKFQKYFNLIRQNNYRLIKTVNNIMDLQKMDSGNYNIYFSNNDIVKFIKNITESSYDYARNQNKNIKFYSEMKKKIIPFDPYEIERAVLNLISNALKYTEPGDSIKVKLTEKKNYINIIVEDTGLGIPQNEHKKIFGNFFRVDDTFYRKSEGSGLGLSIVKFIVKMHNGRIDLKSEKNKGTRFIIKLPQKQENVICDKSVNKKTNSMIDRMDIEYSDIYL